jgi:ATP-binding cassette subfamily C protein
MSMTERGTKPSLDDGARRIWRLLRSLVAYAPARAFVVIALTFLIIATSGVSLIMLVPLLGVAGLDVGGGSVGELAGLVGRAMAAIGLSVSVPTVITAYLGIVTLSAALSHAHAVRSAQLRQGFVFAQRVRLYEAITRVRWGSYVLRQGSSFLHVLTQELDRVSGAVSVLLSLVVKVVMAAVYVGLAVFVSPAATLLVVSSGGALVFLLRGKTRLARDRGEAVSSAYETMYGVISEHLMGLRVTKSHGTEAAQIERFRQRTQIVADAKTDMVRNQAGLSFWLQTGSAAIMAGAFGMALLVFELPLANILLLLFLFARLVPMLTGLQNQVQLAFNLLPAVDRVESMLTWLTQRAETTGSDADVPSLVRGLRLEGVAFAYEGQVDEAVLHDVDIDVPAGRTAAIVGPSGGGKSTVADLVVGLLTPDKGRVLVDGVPLEGGRVGAWRRRIGYVNQDTFLFNDTIRANLLLVRPEATEADLRDALRAASALFVEALPEGLNTVVGDRGVRLSGGERQRIALARAILRKPALLVLDEATSALDPENERVIQEAIAGMAGRQTILLIAHRLASVRGADVIYVMEHGRVAESGGWDELIRRPQGRFRELCRAQGLVDGSQAAIATG